LFYLQIIAVDDDGDGRCYDVLNELFEHAEDVIKLQSVVVCNSMPNTSCDHPRFSTSPLHGSGETFAGIDESLFPIHSTQVDRRLSQARVLPPDISCSPVTNVPERSDIEVMCVELSQDIAELPSAVIEIARNLFYASSSESAVAKPVSDSIISSARSTNIVHSSITDNILSNNRENAFMSKNANHISQDRSEIASCKKTISVPETVNSSGLNDLLVSSFIDDGRTAAVFALKDKSVSDNGLLSGQPACVGSSNGSTNESEVNVCGEPLSGVCSQSQSNDMVITNLRTVTEESQLFELWQTDNKLCRGPGDATVMFGNTSLTNENPVSCPVTREDSSGNFTNIKAVDWRTGSVKTQKQLNARESIEHTGTRVEGRNKKVRKSDVLFKRVELGKRGKRKINQQLVLMEPPLEDVLELVAKQKSSDQYKSLAEVSCESKHLNQAMINSNSTKQNSTGTKNLSPNISKASDSTTLVISTVSVMSSVTETVTHSLVMTAPQTLGAMNDQTSSFDLLNKLALQSAHVYDSNNQSSQVRVSGRISPQEYPESSFHHCAAITNLHPEQFEGHLIVLNCDEDVHHTNNSRDVNNLQQSRSSPIAESSSGVSLSANDYQYEQTSHKKKLRFELEAEVDGKPRQKCSLSNKYNQPTCSKRVSDENCFALSSTLNKTVPSENCIITMSSTSNRTALPKSGCESQQGKSESDHVLSAGSLVSTNCGKSLPTPKNSLPSSQLSPDITSGREKLNFDSSGMVTSSQTRREYCDITLNEPATKTNLRASLIAVQLPDVNCRELTTIGVSKSSQSIVRKADRVSQQSIQSRETLQTPKNSFPSYQPIPLTVLDGDKTTSDSSSQSQTQNRVNFGRIQVHSCVFAYDNVQ